MDPNSFKLFSAVAGVGGEPEIGDFYEGGYFAGYISFTANGVATHRLIVAPLSTQTASLQWQTINTSTPGTSSLFDGATNTSNASGPTNPAANYCANLSVNGYNDWYLPSVSELKIAYVNFKPSISANYDQDSSGQNPYSVPPRTTNYVGTYPAADPAQTSIAAFIKNGSEAFAETYYWSSTEASSITAYQLSFQNGRVFGADKTQSGPTRPVRAFRKVSI